MARHVPRRPVNLPQASGDIFQTASSWLQACLQHHTDCNQDGQGSKPLPTRVIDVGPADGSKDPFLCSTNGRSGQWVTLSYCWGGTEPLKTTSETMAKHEEALLMVNLPPLFQDAVVIARRLKYRYLWIDSLCIIQDSESDWQTESANMGYIYSNAVFTIAAEAASNSEEGILDTSRPAVTYPVKVSCRIDNIQGSVILYRARHDIKGPLSKRAWTLQEDVLSSRVLRWGNKQLTWHCRTVTCSEHDPTGAFNIDSRGYSSNERLYRQSDFKLLCLPRKVLQRRLQDTRIHGTEIGYRLGALSFWDSIVQDFASRALTYDSDRLPALSGVAKEVARHTGYAYKAGIWEEEVHSDLLWRIEGEAATPSTYTAPSWSWAGHRSGSGKAKLATMSTKFRRYESHTVAEILSIDLIHAGLDPYGQVSSGQLKLRAPCLQRPSWDSISSQFDCLPDAEPGTSLHILCVQVLEFPTRKWFSILHKQHFEGEICALLLEPVSNTDNQYRRIGIARVPVKSQVKDGKLLSAKGWFSGVPRQSTAPVLGRGDAWNTQTLTII